MLRILVAQGKVCCSVWVHVRVCEYVCNGSTQSSCAPVVHWHPIPLYLGTTVPVYTGTSIRVPAALVYPQHPCTRSTRVPAALVYPQHSCTRSTPVPAALVCHVSMYLYRVPLCPVPLCTGVALWPCNPTTLQLYNPVNPTTLQLNESIGHTSYNSITL